MFYARYPVSGGGVSSLNGLTGALTLVGAGGITITPSGSDITITGTGGTVTSFSFTNGGGFTGTVTNPTTTPALSLVGTLTGDITGTLTATALTATTNSTLTTLSALSLPASQVSLTPAGVIPYSDGANLTSTTNFTFSASPSMLTLGPAGGASSATATPTTINLGNTYSSTSGINLKLTLLDNTENQIGAGPFGFGVSSVSLDMVSGGNFNFYSGGTKTLFISNTGIFPATAGTGLVGYSGGPFASMTANAFYLYDNFSDGIGSITEVSNGLTITSTYANGATVGALTLATANNASGPSADINITSGTATTIRGAARVNANFLALPSAASDPSGTLVGGEIYYSTTLNVIRIYNGTTWQSVTAV